MFSCCFYIIHGWMVHLQEMFWRIFTTCFQSLEYIYIHICIYIYIYIMKHLLKRYSPNFCIYFWFKSVPRHPNWTLKPFQVPQDEAKMAPRWIQNWYVLASWLFFRDLLPDLRFPMYFCFSGVLKASIFDTFWNNIGQFLDCFWHLGSCMPKEVSRYLHNSCRMAYLSLSGPNMEPSWLQVGSSWAHAGAKLGPTWLKLDPCWAQIRVPTCPWANPSPSKLFQTPSLWRLDLPNPNLCPTRSNINPKKAPRPPT